MTNATVSFTTAIGVAAASRIIVNGNNSTYVGYSASGAGQNSTCIGALSGGNTGGFARNTCLGKGPVVSSIVEVRITTGLGSNMGITGSVCWIDTNILKVNGTTISSDKRIKTDIQSIDQG